jgi:hypothetical protein
MLIGSSPLGKGQTRPLVVVAPTAHGATDRAKIQKITPTTTKMTPIVQRMGLPQKRAATTRQMMPTVIKCASSLPWAGARSTRAYPCTGKRGRVHGMGPQRFCAARWHSEPGLKP